MAHRFHELTFTDAVKAQQDAKGSRSAYARQEKGPVVAATLGPDEKAFLEARDSFYMATVSETGWPYVQHRGGPRGFVKVLDQRTLVFADVRGNRQYISVGNLAANDRAAFIFMDYPNQTRLKLLGHVEVVAAGSLAPDEKPDGDGRPVERFMKVHVEAIDWNCPQGITPRYTVEEIQALTAS